MPPSQNCPACCRPGTPLSTAVTLTSPTTFDGLKNFAKLPEERRFDLNLADIAEVWRHGSVVSSWLLDLLALSLQHDVKLDDFKGHVDDSGEGRWTLLAAMDEDVPVNVLSAALYARF